MIQRSHVLMVVLPLLFLAGAAGLVGVVSGFIGGWGKSSRSGFSENGDSAKDVISTFRLVGHTETGRKKWEVQGDTADLMAETVQLSPVAAKSFGEVDVFLTAQQGQYQKKTQDVHLERNVVITTSDGARLTTNTLDWAAQRETSTTPDWVTVTRSGMKVVGRGGVGFPKLKRVRLERQITVTLQGAQGGETVVTCEGPMEVDYGHRKARFWRNVQVRDAKGSIRSDRMDVVLNPTTNQMDQASFWGHVEVHHQDQIAYANRANYWQTPGRTRLTGHTRTVMLPEETGGQ